MKFDFLCNKLYVSFFSIICTALWGSAFSAIKLSYEEFHIENNNIKYILLFAGIRFFFASILIILMEILWKKKWIYPTKSEIFPIVIIGIINIFLQYFFFYIGLLNTTGIKASLLNSSVTFFTLFFSHFLFREDRLTVKKIIGCFFGIIGVMVININLSNRKNNNISNMSDIDNLSFNILGDGMILLSSLCSSLGTILIKIYNSNNIDELYNNYKNWKISKYLFNCLHWITKILNKGFILLKNKIFNDTLSNNSSEDSCVAIENYSDKIKLKNSKLNHNILKTNYNSYLSKNFCDKSTICSNNLSNNNFSDDEFEDIEISPPYNDLQKISNNYENIKYSHKNFKKYTNASDKNKEHTINDIVDLYIYSNYEKDIIMLTGYQMLIGSLFLIIIGLFWTYILNIINFISFSNHNNNDIIHKNELIKLNEVQFQGYLIVVYLILLTSVSFSLWNILIKYNSVGFLSFFNFLIPIFGTLFSGLLLNENILTIENIISLSFVILGVVISN